MEKPEYNKKLYFFNPVLMAFHHRRTYPVTMRIKHKKLILGLVFLFIAAGIIVFPKVKRKHNRPKITEAATTTPTFAVRTEKAEIRTLRSHIEINANIVSGNQLTVVPDVAGKLVSMQVVLGSAVQKGDILAQVDPSRPGAEYALNSVRAPVSGMVISSPIAVGSTVSTNTSLMIIAVNNTVEIDAFIPEREIGQLRTGLQAEVRVEAYPGEIFAATLALISPLVDPVSRTKKITLRFVNRDQRINPGMFARIKLNTRTYENVVSIPEEALVEHRGRTVVYILETDEIADGMPKVRMREVTAGVNVDGEVEIKKGLNAGEMVVVQGQQFLTDGASVRVLGR